MVSIGSDKQKFSHLSDFSRQVRQNVNIYAAPKEKTITDEYIDATKTQVEKDINGTSVSRNFSGRTANLPIFAALMYDMFKLIDVVTAKKCQFTRTLGKSLKNGAIATIVGAAATYALNNYFNSKSDDNYQKISKKFEELNTDTNAKLADNLVCLNSIDAGYQPVSGKIQLSCAYINDPIFSRNINKVLKHELVHAKQYETVSRSNDGIKKVNYAAINQIKKNMERLNAKETIDLIYEDINNNSEYYKDTKIKILGGAAEVNLKDFITALHIMLNNKDAGYNDIPIVIDSNHYQEVIDKKGRLAQDEEAKADEYYKAMLEYKSPNFFDTINPWSSYRTNILEREAYKENPSIMTWLTNLK